MRIIGLTGGIATGKSSVAAILAQLGATIIDADQLSRDVVAPGGPALAKIVKLLGKQAVLANGSLDRQTVRDMIFSNPEKRQQLEAILHPAIKDLALKRLAEARDRGVAVAIYMAPLLIESGATERVDEIWVVTVKPDVQYERLMARDQCSREQAEKIIAAQMPLDEKERLGTVLIDNSNSLDETRRQVIEAWQQRIAS